MRASPCSPKARSKTMPLTWLGLGSGIELGFGSALGSGLGLEDDATHGGGQLLVERRELRGRDGGEVLELHIAALALHPAQDGTAHEGGAAHLVRVRVRVRVRVGIIWPFANGG